MSEEVIEHRTADTMRTACISDQTREILLVLAAFKDAAQSFCNWRNKYGYERDEAVNNNFSDACFMCEKIILESVSASIDEQMNHFSFKDI